MADSKTTIPRRVYGRKQTRPPKGERLNALETLLPQIQIKLPLNGALFPNSKKETWLEIGFGNGEHLAGLIKRHTDVNFIGAEFFINGMAAFLNHIEDVPHDNIRAFMDDAILLVDELPVASINRIYVLNPDPWPKKRHHKRRIISQDNLTRFARILKPGGLLVMATDVDDLAGWMVTQASNHSAFEWTAETIEECKTMPKDWIITRYQTRGANAGRKQTYLVFKRV